jgi:hypothetical protein
MAEKLKLICDKCKVEMQEIEANFSYLDRTFRHKVNRCPQCGQICLDEELVNGRMSEVESKMEDK